MVEDYFLRFGRRHQLLSIGPYLYPARRNRGMTGVTDRCDGRRRKSLLRGLSVTLAVGAEDVQSAVNENGLAGDGCG
jgi:hypothetical protein